MSNDNDESQGARAIAAFVVVVIGIVVTFLLRPQPDTAPTPPAAGAVTAVAVGTAAESLVTKSTFRCDEELLRLAGAASAAQSDDERAEVELERRWVLYLQQLQNDNDYENWSEPPCDLYFAHRTITAEEARRLELARLHVRGMNLQYVHVSATINSPNLTTIVVPVGTQFVSGDKGKQNMVSAATVRFVFLPVPQNTQASLETRRARLARRGGLRAAAIGGMSRPVMYTPAPSTERTIEQDVPVYCINRWKAVPSSATDFTITFDTSPSPVQKLAACLEQTSAPQRARQLAMWMISDQLTELSPQELAQRIDEHNDEEMTEKLIAIVREKEPNMPQSAIDEFRNLPRAEREKVWAELAPGYRPASKSMDDYRAAAGPLLESCGYDLSTMRFFK